MVPDELIALNAAMGPDALALKYDADGKACFDIPAGEKLPVNANTLGNNYTLAGSVTFGAGAKIEFDTANNPAGMSLTAEGGFAGVTADNVANYVTHTSNAAYDVTLSGNTITVTPARLAHRWSFNGDLNDSVGTAEAQPIKSSVNSGVIIPSPDPVNYVENGTAVQTGADQFGSYATSLNLGTGLVATNDVTLEIWVTRRSLLTNARLFDWGNGGYNANPTHYVCLPFNDSPVIWTANKATSSAIASCFGNDTKYHLTFTVTQDGTSSKYHLVRRKANVLSEAPLTLDHTVADWTLSNVVGGRLYLGHSQWNNNERNIDANAIYDEVRIWNGVVPDELLALNADMGPDTMALKYDANGTASVVVPDGKTLHVNENTVGNYTLAGSVTLEGTAGIEFNFDATQYPNGMSFAAEGGFNVPSGSVADYVTVPEGYDVTLSGNTLSVAPATATSWTGAAGDGDWNNAANWTKGVPTASKTATILASATTMPLTVPADAAYASFTVAGGTLAADTDWSGLAQKPVIAGNVDLNGHDIAMPSCGITIAQSGASFSNSAATTNEVRFLANDATVTATEATYIDGIANLSTAANAKIAIVHSSGNSSGTLNVGAVDKHTVFRAESGTISMTANGQVGMTSGGAGYLDIAGGTVDFCTANSRGLQLGGANARSYVTISGGKLRANWIDAGHDGVTECAIVQTGGEVETGINNNGNVWLGRTGNGKATYTLSDGLVNLTRGTLDVGALGAATFTQDGGTVTIAASDLRVGQESTATGTYTFNSGTVTPKFWFLIGGKGAGTFTQNGGSAVLTGADNNNGNWVAIGRYAGGNGTYVMNDGSLEVGTGTRGGGICVGFDATGVGRFEMNGGTVTAPTIFRYNGHGTVLLNGGTIKAAKDGGTSSSTFASDIGILKNIDNLVFGSNATTIDTDGHNTSITGCGYDTIGGGSFVKAGTGTLTAAMPPVSTLVVSNGTLALSASADNSAPLAALAHRWSFNGNLNDSVGGATATTIGSKADVNYVNDAAVRIGSDQSATYATSLNLGKALSAGDVVTIEIWAKRSSLTANMRLFDWGLSNEDYICMSWNDNANVWVKTGNRDRFANPAGVVNGCFANNVNCHLGVTFTANTDGTTTVRVLRHNLDDPTAETKTLTTTFPSCDLLSIIAGNLYLGHSQYASESGKDATATYDEVRIWKGALSNEALALSAQKGPDATAVDIEAIVAANAAPVSRTLELASGATLNVGAGNTLRQPVVKGSGTIAGGNLVVTERMNVTIGETMSVTDGATLDLTGAELVVTNPEALQKGYTFATAPSGGIVPAAPRPLSGDLRGYRLFLSRTKARIGKSGFTLIVR